MTKPQRILCPTDFSPTAVRAVDHAAEMARTFGAHLLLLHVIPELNYPLRSFGMASALPHLRDELLTRAKESLQKEQARAGKDLKSTFEVRDGDAFAQILESAKANQIDLIVIGTHGYTGLKHALLGSTAEKIVRLSECPVLTVRSK